MFARGPKDTVEPLSQQRLIFTLGYGLCFVIISFHMKMSPQITLDFHITLSTKT